MNAESEELVTHKYTPKKRAMLAHLAKTGNITAAAKGAKIERKSYYNWIEKDPDFLADSQRAINQYAEALEAEADRRAVEGVDEPVYQGGKLVGYKRRYSDLLLIFRLKALKPEQYRERYEHNIQGSRIPDIVVMKNVVNMEVEQNASDGKD